MERSLNDDNELDRPDRNRGDEELDRLMSETEEAIRNTKLFLEHLRSSEHDARGLVDSMKQRLEKDLLILQRRIEAEQNQ